MPAADTVAATAALTAPDTAVLTAPDTAVTVTAMEVKLAPIKSLDDVRFLMIFILKIRFSGKGKGKGGY